MDLRACPFIRETQQLFGIMKSPTVGIEDTLHPHAFPGGLEVTMIPLTRLLTLCLMQQILVKDITLIQWTGPLDALHGPSMANLLKTQAAAHLLAQNPSKVFLGNQCQQE